MITDHEAARYGFAARCTADERLHVSHSFFDGSMLNAESQAAFQSNNVHFLFGWGLAGSYLRITK